MSFLMRSRNLPPPKASFDRIYTIRQVNQRCAKGPHPAGLGERSGSNPGPLDTEPSALTNCASCPVVTWIKDSDGLGPSESECAVTVAIR